MKNPYLYLLKISWRFAGHRKPYLVLTYILFIITNVAVMVEPMLFALFLNRIQRGGENLLWDSAFYLGLFVSVTFIFWLLHGPTRVVERINSFHIVQNYKEYIFKIISSLPLKWHKNHHSGSVMSRVGKSSAALKDFTDMSFMYIEVVVRFFATTIAIFILSTIGGILVFVVGMLVMIIIFAFDKVLVKNLRDINEKGHKADSVFYDYVVNIITVITLRLEKLAKMEVVQKIASIFPLWKKRAILNETKWFTIDIILLLLKFAVLMIYLYGKISAGEAILIGSLVALYQYVQLFQNVFLDLAWKYETVVGYYTDIKSCDIITSQADILKIDTFKSANLKDWKEIKISDLFFKYEDEGHHKHNLSNINVNLKKGLKIAFVGESGSGKSTLMALLRGLERADRVVVEIDGVSYDSLQVLSDMVTLMPQDPEIFENTIEYNLAAGLRHSKAEILRACDLACFTKVLERLPSGLKTNIKEKGVNLSGGEKQRLALARGIFAAKSSSIVLMDEPTSSVDSQNEIKIYHNIFKEFKDKCIISSIHRLHLLSEFDVIYLFEKGVLVDMGSFEELLNFNKLFQKMWSLYEKSVKK
ncbi:MAG: ABC transporter ATP-binding protein [Patescibacteria group bacterium]